MAMLHKKPERIYGVRGTVIAVRDEMNATVKLDGAQYKNTPLNLHVSAFKRALDCRMNKLSTFVKRGDNVVLVIEPNNGRSTGKWGVFDVHRAVFTPRPRDFQSPGSYMDMAGDRIPLSADRNLLEITKLLVSIRRVLSVWNEVELATFMSMWRFQKGVNTSQDATSLRRFVDSCLTGVYCECSGGLMKLYQGFSEEEINREIKRRFESTRKEQPRKLELNSSISGARVLESKEDMAAALDPLLEKANKGQEVVLGLVCEGNNLGPMGSVTLILLATLEGAVFIFDVLKNPALLKSGGSQLHQILQDQRVLKVVHDCRHPSSALKRTFGVKLSGVFDTEVAYATIMEQCNKTGRPFHIGFKALCLVLGEDMTYKDEALVAKIRATPKYWEHRPLTDEMKNYGAGDTVTLVAGVYRALNGMINALWRDYFEAKCKDALSEM